MGRPLGKGQGGFALAHAIGALVAMLAFSPAAWGQFGTILRDQKISSVSGGFAGNIGNEARFGVSVAELGDFDGDGFRDLAVGSHRADIGGEERGAVWLLLLNSDGTVRQSHEISSQAGGFTAPLDDRDRFGISICPLGDLDLDGTVDLAVGAYRDDDGNMDAGCVYILFLRPDGTVKAHQKISALEGGFTGFLNVEDSFGWSVESIGDLDDDGVIDLAVGATRDDGADPDTARDFGALYVLFLKRDGTVKSFTKISAESGALGATLRPRDRFGSDIVLLEDADGDGVEDIAVGAFGEDPTKYGKVLILPLNVDGTVKAFTEIGPNMGGFTGVLGKGDRFGISLAADDLDGDGIRDLVIGAAGDDDGGAEAGCVWICLLNALGRVTSYQKVSSDFGGFGGPIYPGDNFGISCATLGDIDRDGAVDLAVGAYQDDDGGFDRGAAWVLFRAGTGTPVADFVSNPNSGDGPLTVTFLDRSSGSITSWSWDFGDGMSSTVRDPVHIYSFPGVYDVELAVSGPLGTDSFLRHRTVVVLESVFPLANFSAAPRTGAAPLAVVFSDLSTGSITSWSWDFGDGTGSSARSPSHVYESVGDYDVSLTATGPLGRNNLTVSDMIQVLVPPPVAGFSADVTSGLYPLTVTFTDQSSLDTTSWQWDFGDGEFSNEQSPVHTYTAAGIMDVTLTASGAGGSNQVTQAGLVDVREPVAAVFTIVPPGGPAPVAVQFTNESRGAVSTWLWDFGDGTTSSKASPAHLYGEAGTFVVSLTVSNASELDSATGQVVIVEPPPVAQFSVSTRAGFAPLEVTFTDRSLGNITSWLWDFGDGTESAEANPVHVYRFPGVYTVRFRVWSAGGLNGVVRPGFIDADFLRRRTTLGRGSVTSGMKQVQLPRF